MPVAAQLRFLTYARGISRRFIDFAVDAYDSSRNATPDQAFLHELWTRHFANTGFEQRQNEFYEVAAEILLSRAVDAFQFFLADVIGWALWRRPTADGLQEQARQIADDYGLELDEATARAAELYAEQLSFGGFNKMVNFIETTFSVTLIIEPETRQKLRRIIAVRNMIAHNHSRKNRRFCKDVGEPISHVGQRVRPSLAEAHDALQQLSNFVSLVDDTLSRELLGEWA